MQYIDASKLTDEALTSHDDMMVECISKIHNFSSLATAVWTYVLKELDRRGKVKLTSGSYDDIGNALIQRQR